MSTCYRRTIFIALPLLLLLTVSPGVALGGLNGDGNLDAVFVNLGQPDRVCLGDGAGGFGCGNVSRAASEIGVSRPTLHGLLHKHNLQPAEFRQR